MPKNEEEMIYLYTCLSLVGLHFIITNAYLRTSWGLNQLFPNLPLPSHDTIQIQEVKNEPALDLNCSQPVARETKHVPIMSWAIFTITLVTTIGLFAMIGYQSLSQGNLIIHSHSLLMIPKR